MRPSAYQELQEKWKHDIESELSAIREDFAASLKTSTALLQKTQGRLIGILHFLSCTPDVSTDTITQERRKIEKAQQGAVDSMQSLEQTLAKSQMAVATLQTQRLTDQRTMEGMAKDIAQVLAIQTGMGTRLELLDQREQTLVEAAKITNNLVAGLELQATTNDSLHPTPPTPACSLSLAAEFSLAEPSHTVPDVAGWSWATTYMPTVHMYATQCLMVCPLRTREWTVQIRMHVYYVMVSQWPRVSGSSKLISVQNFVVAAYLWYGRRNVISAAIAAGSVVSIICILALLGVNMRRRASGSSSVSDHPVWDSL